MEKYYINSNARCPVHSIFFLSFLVFSILSTCATLNGTVNSSLTSTNLSKSNQNVKIDNTLPASNDSDSVNSSYLSIDEVFKFKRKCCPLDKVFVRFDETLTAICNRTERSNLSEIQSQEREPSGHKASPFECTDYSLIRHFTNVIVFKNGSILKDGFPIPSEYDPSCYDVHKDELTFFACEKDKLQVGYIVLKIINCLFLTGFLVCYNLKPGLHTLHKRCLMRYVICLYAKCLVSIYFQLKFSNFLLQYVSAVLSYFFFMASFSWSTIICYDIWSGIRLKTGRNHIIERESAAKKIRRYEKYAWGIAAVLLVIAVAIDYYCDDREDECLLVPPNFAQIGDSWMGSNEAMYLYFYGPLLTLNLINVVFFISTMYTITQNKKFNNNFFNENGSRRHVQAETTWFSIFAKLYIVMGISWILDIVAFELGDPKYESDTVAVIVYFIEVFNICQGILIFFITIVRKETAQNLSQRINLSVLKPKGSLTTNAKRPAASFLTSCDFSVP